MRGSPSKSAFALIVALAVLAGCDKNKQASNAPALSAGPFADILADPAGHAGAPVEFKVSLAAGKQLLPSGETATAVGQSWDDPPGTPHSFVPGQTALKDATCVFVVMNDKRTPILPLEPIVVDNMTPCLAGSVPPVLTGKVQGVRDLDLVIYGKPETVKAIVLTEPNFKAPF